MLATISGEFTCGGDPELRYTPGGVAVASLRAVSSSRKKNPQTDQWEDDKSSWVTLTIFNKLAENVAESLRKGDKVIVIGRAHNEEWTDKEGGNRLTPKILVDLIGPSLTFATAKVTKAERSGGQSSGAQRSSAPADDPWSTGPSTSTPDEPPF